MADPRASSDDVTGDARSAAATPVRMTPLDAVRRHPVAFALPVVLLVAATVAFGLARKPQYTAEARLGLVRVNVSAPGALAGFAVASQSLAEAYSRALGSEAVIDAVAKRVHSTRARVASRLSAVPIPDTPIFRVIASGGDARQTVRLANTASAELVRNIVDLNRSGTDSDRLFKQFRAASLQASQLRAQVDDAVDDYKDSRSAENRAKLVAARADHDAATLRAGALRGAYELSLQGQSSTSLLSVLAQAQDARSDRTAKLEILVFIGALAGIALGLACAILLSGRDIRRTLLG